ncbi:hypothetical protein OG225_33315 [Nocardia sp. NBC_01377]|uniref:hypothetical protein n=1 Tax=Nocardia sp. NBC_01377 TaxID=2903595 RepID=UPI0032516ED7
MTSAVESSGADESAAPDIAVIADEFGAVVVGDEALIAEFVDQWSSDDPDTAISIPDAPVSNVAGKVASSVMKTTAPATRYIQGSRIWENASRPKPGTVVTFHKTTRAATTGKILSNPQVALAPVPGIGQAVLAHMAVTAALEQLADRIEAHLDRIEDKVDDVLRLASAQRLGDVYGHRRILRRRVAEISAGAVLTETDWSSVAALGADLEVGVERLRQHAADLIAQLRPDDSADKRAEQLRSAVDKGMLGETLNLLLVAQQSLYLWQRLRLERTRLEEPDYLEQTVGSARATLREHIEADAELAGHLRTVLDRHAALRVSEVHRPLAGRTLARYRVPLARTLDAFIEARALQVESWNGVENASIRDALWVARGRTIDAANTGRRQISAGASAVARWVEPKADGSESGETEQADTPPS